MILFLRISDITLGPDLVSFRIIDESISISRHIETMGSKQQSVALGSTQWRFVHRELPVGELPVGELPIRELTHRELPIRELPVRQFDQNDENGKITRC